jgi:carbamoyltransferase
MNIVGLSAYYHDSAACLLRDGELIAAAQEERFTRKRHDQRFPEQALRYCLTQGGLSTADIDAVVFYDKPLLKFARLLETYLQFAPRGLRSYMTAMPLWLSEKLWTRQEIAERVGHDGPVLFTEHHESHAASAFYPSPFERAAILTVDGVGEWATSSFGVGDGNRIELLAETRFPHSLGLLYSAFTYYLGFKVNSGEYKVMGLAPYGEPRFVRSILSEVADVREDGSLRLNMAYFDFAAGLTMTSRAFDRLFGGPPRIPESPLTQRDMDLARSVQEVTELCMLRMARHVHRETGERALTLAGGVALNCVANGRLLREGPFSRIWVQPAAGDAGGAVGAALAAWHQYYQQPRRVCRTESCDRMQGSYLGPSFTDREIAASLDACGAHYRSLDPVELIERTAGLIAEGKVVGWFQGRMEFGPRALGARSILGDPRSPRMQSQMNLKIKFRESFRPFAPSVLRERAGEWFELNDDSPYMLLVAPVHPARRAALAPGEQEQNGLAKLNVQRSQIPAVTHVDCSARVQTVRRQDNPAYYDLLSAFERLTGCPVLVNTSFNVRGEPIVCTPEQAYTCFMRTGIDALAIGRHLLIKDDQPPASGEQRWQEEFLLD